MLYFEVVVSVLKRPIERGFQSETWGSAPRPAGSQLVIDGAGNFEGSVSGGCVEGSVVEEALDVIASGKPRLLEFGVADESAWRVGLTCGGTIKVYVEKIT